MQPIEPPDSHHLSAAIGWMELGVAIEAESELDCISAANQSHPDVLEVRWIVLAQRQRWDKALMVAQSLVKLAPTRSTGWLHRAYSLRRVSQGGLQQAWDALLPAYEKFPKEPTISYNLSCYACQMRHLDEARNWFKRALKAGEKERIKAMALEDPDLEPLWAEIRAI
ncbi:MAG: tetratricopeptide repeat protein [Verrucomicrobiota bacterium]